jgi:serine/threonine protein kinase
LADLELEKFGKYKVTGRIGTGSMGQVFLAQDPVLKRDVAIKTMSAKTAADAQLVQRFQREAQSAARLNHPNIITVYDFGEEQGQFYMAMELLKGKDLKDLIGTTRLVSLRQKLDLMEQISEGVGFAHSRGVIHRDLKPGNIHVQPNGRVKILDFGLARPEDSEMTQAGMVMGTPNYMSPEQVRGQKADPRSDVFSLGAVFYEVLVARRAFRAETMHKILERVLMGQPDPIQQFLPDVPQNVVTLIERALNKAPADRFQDAAELGRAIQAVRASLSPEQLDQGAAIPGLGLADPEVGDSVAAASQATVLEAGSSFSGSSAPSIHGANRSYAPRPGGAPTLHGQAPAQPGTTIQAPQSSPLPLLLAIGLLLLVIGVGVAYWMSLDRTNGTDTAGGTDVQRDMLTETLITTQLELAEFEFSSKNYQQAIEQANQVLALAPDHPEASALIQRAQGTLDELTRVSAQARAAFEAGDIQGASTALSRVLTLDPRADVVAELSPRLSQHFQAQAASAQQAMQQARTAAAAFPADEAFRRAETLAEEATQAMQSQTYVVAAQKYLESRDAFDLHRRAGEAEARTRETERRAEERRRAEEARRLADLQTTPPPPPPTTRPTATPPPVTTPSSVATTLSPATLATPPPTTLPPVTAPPPVTISPQEVAVRAVLDRYAQAYEGRNMALLKQIYPSFAEEKKLGAAFKQIKRWQVGISVESLSIQGSRATVVVGRQDVVNGTETPRQRQTFSIVQVGGNWVIESVGG